MRKEVIAINTIYFNVSKQRTYLSDKSIDATIASKARNYVVANFQFEDSDWQEKKVTAIFTNSNIEKNYSMIVGANPELTNTECYIPWEVLEKEGVLSVSVCAGNLQTTVPAKLVIKDSEYTKGEESLEASPTVYMQILNYVKEIENQGISNEFAKEVIQRNIGTILEDKEDVSNKVQTMFMPSESYYPSVKAVWDFVLAHLEDKEDIDNKTTSIDDNSTDEQYPSAKAVWDLFSNAFGGVSDLIGGEE